MRETHTAQASIFQTATDHEIAHELIRRACRIGWTRSRSYLIGLRRIFSLAAGRRVVVAA